VCSLAVDNLVSNCAVHYKYITSDHKPISVTLNHLLPSHDVSDVNNWSSCDENCIEYYQYELDIALARISIPSVLLNEHAGCNNVLLCENLLDNYYSDIVSCICRKIRKLVCLHLTR